MFRTILGFGLLVGAAAILYHSVGCPLGIVDSTFAGLLIAAAYFLLRKRKADGRQAV